MNKLFISLMFAMIMLVGIVNAVDRLPPVQLNQCINITQTCATCTYNNISVIRYPNNGTLALNTDTVMTK